MAQDTSTPSDDIAPSDDVVEWGAEDRRRGGRLGTLAASLGVSDRHLTTAAAAAGAALAGLSLLTDWQITNLTQQLARIEAGVAGVGAWGSGYLLGLLGLLALTATALYGAPEPRRHLRLAGLGWAAGLLGLLVAAAVNLGERNAALNFSVIPESQGPEYELSYGPGLFLALAGVALLTAALYLSDRTGSQKTASEKTASEGTASDGTDVAEAGRPRVAGAPEPPVPAGGPSDLTVSPTTPFVHLPEAGERW